MNKEYTVEEFIKAYDRLSNATAKKSLVESLKIADYVGINKKDAVVKLIAKKTAFNSDGNYEVNSTARYVLHMLYLIDLYTNINITFTKMDSEFDELSKRGLLKLIIDRIPTTEKQEFESLLYMAFDDIEANYNSLNTFIASQVERFGKLIGVTMTPTFDAIADEIKNVDVKELAKSFVRKNA